ncbi:hypothetical protein ACWOFR_14865 [Carnobacterium gallinarum]|uniref:hypothetical protein n=1 Tax=Carnobacterium gallinarum TaxID=2749 RepID=UPI000A953807|nr:hypothetical protein [Carnobacterium gallinarum]
MDTKEWIETELKKLATDENSLFIIEETLKYIDEITTDNNSLQIALEGEIWSPKKWGKN